MNDYWNIDGSELSPNVAAFTIDGPAYTLLNMPFDAKTCNYYQIEDRVCIETISDYLARIHSSYRMPGVFVTMLIMKEGATTVELDMDIFEAALDDFDFKIYRFEGGIADEDFKEYVSLLQHVLATNEGLGEFHTISGASAGHVLRASSPTEANFQKLNHTELLSIGAYLHSQIDSHIDDPTIHRKIKDDGTSNIDLLSAEKILSLITTAAAGGMIFMGGYNALTDTPVLTGGVGVLKGHTYVVTVGGDVQFDIGDTIKTVLPGDMLIANTDTPLINSDWTFVIKDIPTIVDASETYKGILKLATNIDVTTGTDDTKAITPLKLKNLGYARKFTQELIGGANYETVLHSLNTLDVVVSVREIGIDSQIIEATIMIEDANNIKLVFNEVILSSKYKVTIIG